METEIFIKKAQTMVEFTSAILPSKSFNAAMAYLDAVGRIAIDHATIPGVIEDSKFIDPADNPQSQEQKEAHQKLLTYIAEKFGLDPQEVQDAKATILNACENLD